MRQPTIFLPHGAGPCFFMEWTMGPRDSWDKLAAWLRSIEASLPAPPRALLVISAHWETTAPTVLASPAPPLYFDYSGFPPHTYELEWKAPGSPVLAKRVQELLSAAGIASSTDATRGFDHGVFIPLKVAFPDAKFPTIQLSLQKGLDPAVHLAVGRALAPLRDEGVLIIGSGLSFHNMRAFQTGGGGPESKAFDDWLSTTVVKDQKGRDAELGAWANAPSARDSHPREEHLLPLMVAAGAAAEDRGEVVFRDIILGKTMSAVRFG